MINHRNWVLAVTLLLAGTPYLVLADSDVAQLMADCGDCHALNNPNYTQQSATERKNRKAPPLFYAGNKFNRTWLVAWLQNPERIRPAGYYPPAHILRGADGDSVDTSSLPEHTALSAADAAQTADYLMSLKPFTSLVEAAAYEPGTLSWKMGNLTFGKFNGCDACHRDAPDYGGTSGPELYTAWARLQPGFIASYIADPVAWDPHTLMPGNSLNPEVVKKLADYLKVNGEDFK